MGEGKTHIQGGVDDASMTTDEAPPDYDEVASPTMAATSPSPYIPFPSVMEAYYQWNLAGLKTFHICNASKERLYAVEVHTGYSLKDPLGFRPGLFLYNGVKTRDPLIAAVGDESQMAS